MQYPVNTIIGRVNATAAAGDELFSSLEGTTGAAATIALGTVSPMPRDGVLSDLAVCVGDDQTDDDLTVAVNVNGSDTVLAILVPAGSADGALYINTDAIITVQAGDLVSIHLVNAAGDVSAKVGDFSMNYN